MLRTASLLIFMIISSSSAQAGLKICNKYDVQHSISVAYSNGDDFVSEGWWNIDPQDCKTVVSGDLKQRYYYYRATATGRDFEGEGYYFCTKPDAYTIVGVDNCQSRSFDRSEFRKLDTGKTNKDFTLTLTPSASEIAGSNAGVEEGDYGEPYSGQGVFQGCDVLDGAEFCVVQADGWMLYAQAGDGTPDYIIDQFYTLPEKARVEIQGEITSYGDISADIIIRSLHHLGNAYGQMYEDLQGEWYSVDDSNAHLLHTNNRQESYYDGQFVDSGTFRIAPTCDGAGGAGPVLVVQDDNERDAYCYVIYELDYLNLTLGYVGGNGTSLQYGKLD